MRKNSLIGLMALVLALGITGVAVGKEASKPPKTLIASGHPEWPPVMFKKGKTITGAGPELARKIFADLGIKIETPYSGSWEDVLSKGAAGKIDLIVAAYKTKERKKHFVYSDPYTVDPLVLFVHADKTFKFKKSSDLVGKSGVGLVGDSYGQKFDDYSAAHLKLRRVKTVTQAFNLIAHHRADYFINSLYAGKLEIEKNKLTRFVSLPTAVSEQNFYMMISKKSPYARYMPEINRLIKKYKQDGTIDRLVAKYE